MGIHVAGGSDAPIERPNPFEGLHASIFRYDRNGIREGGESGESEYKILKTYQYLIIVERATTRCVILCSSPQASYIFFFVKITHELFNL